MRFLAIIDKYSECKVQEANVPRFDITVAGEINLDLILYGLPQSIPMEREILAENFEFALGNSSAILAQY